MVGLSGGVDSAVCAALLQQQGHQLQAVFMQNWVAQADDPYCTAEQDLVDARAVCDHLDIPLQVVNFAKDYWDRVFQRCLNDFAAGLTPNPDVLCNREIKFACLLDYARQQGAAYLATGHYARITQDQAGFHLLRGLDPGKDQSYFLHLLNQQQLAAALFPLGGLTKTHVRKLALELGLPNADKPDSTGICFIGERRFKPFLAEYLLAQPGPIQDSNGLEVGRHDGLMFYTLGQRKGLGIGGRQGCSEQAWYVIEKRIKDNVLLVAQGKDHPALYAAHLSAGPIHWITPACKPKLRQKLYAQIRYRQQQVACQLIAKDADTYEVQFEVPQWAITPGQSVVFYDAEKCLGGGVIQPVQHAQHITQQFDTTTSTHVIKTMQ